MKRPWRAALTLVALAAIGAAAYFTKPGGNASSPGRPAPPAAGGRPIAAGGEGEGEEAVRATPKTADAPPVVKEHGADAVVRSSEQLGGGAAAGLPLATPVWNAPVELTFSSFKALRRSYRAAKAFSPDEVARLHGAAALVRGALMPIDPVPKSGEMKRFWLANPVVVMAGCVFCFPPTLADLVYVTTDGAPLVVDRERLYRSVEYAKLLGRLELGPGASDDGVEYMFSMKMRERLE